MRTGLEGVVFDESLEEGLADDLPPLFGLEVVMFELVEAGFVVEDGWVAGVEDGEGPAFGTVEKLPFLAFSPR